MKRFLCVGLAGTLVGLVSLAHEPQGFASTTTPNDPTANVVDGWDSWTRSQNNCTTGWKDPMNGFGWYSISTTSMSSEYYDPVRTCDTSPCRDWKSGQSGSSQNLTHYSDCNTNSAHLATSYGVPSNDHRFHQRYRQAGSRYPAFPAHEDVNVGSGDSAYSFNSGRNAAAYNWYWAAGPNNYTSATYSGTGGCTKQPNGNYVCGDGVVYRWTH